MRSPALLAALVGGVAVLAPSFATAQVALLRQACLGTAMQQDAYVEFAADRGWSRSIRIVVAGDPSIAQNWEHMFRDESTGIQSWMSGQNAISRSDATSCGIADTDPAETWRQDMEALAVELGMLPTTATPGEQAIEAGAWLRSGPDALSLSYDRYPSGVTVRLRRPVSPPGN